MKLKKQDLTHAALCIAVVVLIFSGYACDRGANPGGCRGTVVDPPDDPQPDDPQIDGDLYYVAPDGNDGNPGTLEQPFATMNKAQQVAQPGDVFYFRGGTYYFSGNIDKGVVLDKSGQTDKRIHYWAYPGEKPVFDFSGMNAKARLFGILVTGNWIHLKGFEMTGVRQTITTQNESFCIYVGGDNNIFELLDLHHNMGPGIRMNAGGNLVLNCDSHHNYDPYSANGDGENADGFGCHPSAGDVGNVFRGCRAWYNSDDGWDLIASNEMVIIENCWAFKNGYKPDTNERKGNGNGFKSGGYGGPGGYPVSDNPPRNIIRNNIAYLNLYKGFDANYHPTGIDWYNNSAYRNGINYGLLYSNGNFMRNNLSFAPISQTIRADGVNDTANNSWTMNITVDASDFISLDEAELIRPRKADGSLPDINFLKPRPGSDLIDTGVDVGLPYKGNAPDIGAWEQ